MLSYMLVTAQFLCIALIVSPIDQLLQPQWNKVVGLVIVLLASGIAIWALLSMRRGTFTVMPEPTNLAAFTHKGPYRLVRHPMYSAVLLACFGICFAQQNVTDYILLGLLIVVLIKKIQLEENYLLDRYPEYANYRTSTKSLIPKLL